jgi:hypothetical protein
MPAFHDRLVPNYGQIPLNDAVVLPYGITYEGGLYFLFETDGHYAAEFTQKDDQERAAMDESVQDPQADRSGPGWIY